MTLNRRALLIILPVVLVSNLLVAFSVYWVQRNMIEDAESTQFTTRMNGLAASLSDSVEFTRNLVFSMLSGDAVRDFVREENRGFKATGLGVRVQDGIKFFSATSRAFVSFAIIGPNGEAEYYFENSDDPFAEIPPQQVWFAKRLLEGSSTVEDNFAATPDGGLIVHSQLIDRRTFETPLATQREFAYVVQAAVRTSDYSALKSRIEQTYGTTVYLTGGPDAVAGNDAKGRAVAHALTPDLTLSGSMPEAYLQTSLNRLMLILLAGSVALSLLSVGWLLFLIRRIVTQPIAKLDREVKEVIDGVREEMSGSGQTGEVGRLSENIKSMHDEMLRAFRRVQQMTWTDSLTGISNRPRFNLVGQTWMARAGADGRSFSLLFLDLDNFKSVNDTFGHAAGDAVLKAFASRVGAVVESRRSAETEVLFFRLAGDEFAILLAEGEGAAVVLAADIVQLFGEGLNAANRTYPVTASIGVATAPDHATVFDDLISCADIAMYHAKAEGRDGFKIFAPELAMRARAS